MRCVKPFRVIMGLLQAMHGHKVKVLMPGCLVRLSSAACDGLAPTWSMHGTVLRHTRMHNKGGAVVRQPGAERAHREGALAVRGGRHVDGVNQDQNLWRGLGQVLCYAPPQLRSLQCQDPSSQPAPSHLAPAPHEADDLPASTPNYRLDAFYLSRGYWGLSAFAGTMQMGKKAFTTPAQRLW